MQDYKRGAFPPDSHDPSRIGPQADFFARSRPIRSAQARLAEAPAINPVKAMPKIPAALARSSRSDRVARRTALAAAAVLAVGAVVATVSVAQLAAADQLVEPTLAKATSGQTQRIGTLAEVLELRAAHAAEVASVQAAQAAQAAYLLTPAGAQATAQSMAASQYGWGDDQFSCLVSLWNRESGWNVNSYNADSGAAGIPQALPGDKMAIIAPDWQTNPATQIAWGLAYISSSYGTPCSAWNHSEGYNWY